MKVAICTREYPPEVYGGAGVHVEHLARALVGHVDVAVHAFGAPRPDPLVAATYQPWQTLHGGAPYLAALRTFSVDLAMAAALRDADVVHTHTWYANLAGHLSKLTYGIPHVMTSHSLEPLRPRSRGTSAGRRASGRARSSTGSMCSIRAPGAPDTSAIGRAIRARSPRMPSTRSTPTVRGASG